MTFNRPFVLDGFKGTLPAGTYELESEQELLDGMSLPDCPRTSVLIHLHSKIGSPALAQTRTVPWEVLERAQIRDQAPAESPSDVVMNRLLADPIVRMVMLSDGVSETDVRRVVSAARARPPKLSSVDDIERARLPCRPSRSRESWTARRDRAIADLRATDRGENEGMALLPA